MSKKQLRALLLSIVLSSAGYGLWVGLSDPAQITDALKRIGIQGALIILGLSLVNYVLRFARYHWLMKHIGDQVPTLPNFLYYLSGFALTTTPGKAGESIRYLYLKPFKVPFEHAIAVLLTERLFDLLAVWFLALLGLWAYEDYRWVIVVTAALCSIAVLLVQQPFLLRFLRANTLSAQEIDDPEKRENFLQKVCRFGADTLTRTKQLLGIKPFCIGLALGVVSWGAEAIGFVYLLDLLGYDLNPMIVAAIYAAAMLIGAISFLPGGLGGAEITMHLLLLSLAVSEADSVAATLICRIATLWFAVLIGVLVMVYLEVFKTHGPDREQQN